MSTLFVRITNPAGIPVEETFVGFHPGLLFPAPTVGEGSNYSQEQLSQLWESGQTDFRITSFFGSDVYELAQKLREWCDQGGEFPFRFHFGTDGTPHPVTRSVLCVRLLPAIPRAWYRERPIVFEFRPVNRVEAYELEATYWRSVGDEARAALATEIRDRLTNEELTSSNTQSPLDGD
jgi:hypothetical protein